MDISMEWTTLLEEEDWNFIKRFILNSGSLKEMASYYDVTYPTVRLKLDRLIQKIELSDNAEDDTFILMVKNLLLNDKLEYDIAKLLISEYRKRGNK